MYRVIQLVWLFIIVINANCYTPNHKNTMLLQDLKNKKNGLDTATFAGGCFWCIDAIFRELKGVVNVTPGYSGGHQAYPTYKDVCMGTTGHAEVCQIIFDPDSITFDELLEVFFLIHDPTSLNQQGNDIGTQYRSAIFYHNDAQKNTALEYIRMLNSTGDYNGRIVTEVTPFSVFYKAEEYHQNYYGQNASKPYCIYVIQPKLFKFRKVFKDKIKVNESLN